MKADKRHQAQEPVANTKPVPRNFRVWPENNERLAFADKSGLNVSELINEVLQEHLKSAIEAKFSKIRERVSAPVP